MMSDPATPPPRDFEADRAICDAAPDGDWAIDDYVCKPGDTPNTWHVYRSQLEDDPPILSTQFGGDKAEDIARFCAAARTGWPAALDEIRRLQTATEQAEQMQENAEHHEAEARAAYDHILKDWEREQAARLRLERESDALARAEAERDAIQETLTEVEGAVAEVYCTITNNRFAKCNTAPVVILDEFNARLKEAEQEMREDRDHLQAMIDRYRDAYDEPGPSAEDYYDRLNAARDALLSAATPPPKGPPDGR